MAFVLARTSPWGFSAPDAYWDTKAIGLDWPSSVRVKLRIYRSRADFAAGKPAFAEEECQVPLGEIFGRAAGLSAEALEAALDAAIMAMPDYAGAVAV